jgi:hypothetical protein
MDSAVGHAHFVSIMMLRIGSVMNQWRSASAHGLTSYAPK